MLFRSILYGKVSESYHYVEHRKGEFHGFNLKDGLIGLFTAVAGRDDSINHDQLTVYNRPDPNNYTTNAQMTKLLTELVNKLPDELYYFAGGEGSIICTREEVMSEFAVEDRVYGIDRIFTEEIKLCHITIRKIKHLFKSRIQNQRLKRSHDYMLDLIKPGIDQEEAIALISGSTDL